MTGISGKLGLAFVLCAFAAPAALAQDIQATFDQGVDLMRRGHDEEALRAFESVLAADPTNEQAYELFRRTEQDVWIQILSKQGDFELVGRRLIGLASLGRLEVRDDPAKIRELVGKLDTNDPVTRKTVTRQLAAEHGEYAVPYLLPALGDSGNETRQIAAMMSLPEMGLDVVAPLTEALEATDPYLRRNVALTLGRMGDVRAVPMLANAAAKDADPGVRQAAQEALSKLGARGAEPAAAFLQAGKEYIDRHGSVLAPHLYSDVVWRWEGDKLASVAVPREIYPEVMARKYFHRALAADPSSTEALAGYVRAHVGAATKVAALAASGADVSAIEPYVNDGSIAVGYAGVEATDRALQTAVAAGDVVASMGLVDAVRAVAARPTPGLQAALSSDSGALRSAAAVALAQIAVQCRTAPYPAVVEELSRAVGRGIVRIAFIIDGNAERSASIAAGLQSQGIMVDRAATGGMGLARLNRLPGLDVVLVADRLPDLTAHQVLSELASDPRFKDTPRLVITDDAEHARELFGEKAAGFVAGGDVSGVPEALSTGLNRDRQEADLLSQAAARSLAELAGAGFDIAPTLDALAGTLATRPDTVAVPASIALQRAGTGAQIPALVAVVADTTKSDEVRAGGANAIAGIVARGAGTIPSEGTFTLQGVAESDAAVGVRLAAARAVGASSVPQTDRAGMVQSAIAPKTGGEKPAEGAARGGEQ
jgi:CheY-like chemotaxis protein